MNQFNEIVKNVLMQNTHTYRIQQIKNEFPEVGDFNNNDFLSLYKYINTKPYCFYSKLIYKQFFDWLINIHKRNYNLLDTFFLNNESEINQSILQLREINLLYWHDDFEQLDDYELIRFIDQKIHPSYLRLVEAVYAPLCKIVAYFSRIGKNKGIDDLNDLWPITQEVQKTSLAKICDSYNHLVRNAIAHGGITYFQKEISYKDKKGNEEILSDYKIIRLYDDLLDTCNSLVLSLTLFLLINHQKGYNLFQQLLIEELREQTQNPLWNIIGCTPSSFTGLNQLIIHARSLTNDFGKVQMFTIQSGILAEKFAPGYDRYFISIRTNSSFPGWASLDGKKLKNLRNLKNVLLEDYKDVVDDNLVFFVPKIKLPKMFYKIHTYLLSARLQFPISIQEFKDEFNLPNILIRDSQIHRNSWGCVLKGSVVIKLPKHNISQEIIRKYRKKIIKKSLKHARHKISKFNILRYIPLVYSRVFVFSNNYRKRRLTSFGLDEDLICTIQIQKIKRIKSPDIMCSTIEQIGGYRIAWNKQWLENSCN